MYFDLISLLLLFPLVATGLAWPLVARLDLEPVDKPTTSLVLSLLGAYAPAWPVNLPGRLVAPALAPAPRPAPASPAPR